jgi:hypothetical protein
MTTPQLQLPQLLASPPLPFPFPFPTLGKNAISPFDLPILPLIYPLARIQQLTPQLQSGGVLPNTMQVTTGTAGQFTQLISSSTPALQGQLINVSGDSILVAGNSSGTGAFTLPPTGINTFPSFNFGPVDLSGFYIASKSLNGQQLNVYWEGA